jgi:hypothetical protein
METKRNDKSFEVALQFCAASSIQDIDLNWVGNSLDQILFNGN